MSKDLKTTPFLDLLPSSIAGDDKFIAAARVLDNELNAVTDAIGGLLLYADIDNLPEPVLKHLAWQWHVDFWDDDLTIEQKRTVVKQAYPWHRKKGTPAAVEMVLEDVLGGGYVKEWWEYGGEPKHFKVFSNMPPEDAAGHEHLLLAIDKARNERSILDAVEKPVSMTGDLVIGGVMVSGGGFMVFQEQE
ncbi:MAG: phage tail protein I [Desulfobacterales bacterium]|nr:phage tail protein I [Desulfobacterales bacterium]